MAESSLPSSQSIPAVVYIDSEFADDFWGYYGGLLVVVRTMLLAPEDDDKAASTATRQLREFYHDKSLEEGCPWAQDDDHNIPWFLSAAAELTLDVAAHVPIGDFRHGRLVDFLVGLKDQASSKFDPEDPQLTWLEGAYSPAVAETGKPRFSSQSELIESTKDEDEAKEACEERINFSSVAAHLLARGVLTSVEVERFAQDIVEGLQGRKSDRLPPQLLVDFRAVVAARHLILAGEVFVREARNPSTSRGADLLSETRWKAWAVKLAELVARGPTDSSPWPVQDLAGEALERIRNLYPEVVVDLER